MQPLCNWWTTNYDYDDLAVYLLRVQSGACSVLCLLIIRPLQLTFGSSSSASHPIHTAERSLVFNLPKFYHIISLPHFLHWLPVPAHNRFKTRMLIYNAKNEPTASWKQLNPALPHRPFKTLVWLNLTHCLSRCKENSVLALRWWNEFLLAVQSARSSNKDWRHISSQTSALNPWKTWPKTSTCTVLYYPNSCNKSLLVSSMLFY